VQCLRGLFVTAALTPSDGLGSTNSRRRDASSTRSWPFYTKSLAWMPSPTIYSLRRAFLRRGSPERETTIDARRRTILCRGSPARGTATDASAVRLSISRTATHLRHRHTGRRSTTTDAPTEARTSTPTPMLTPCHSSDGRLRTSPLRPCCCAAARSLQPLRSDGCSSS
jgi:hypothetical protein